MADLPRYPETSRDGGAGFDREPSPGTQRWVKVGGIIAIVVILSVVIMLIAGGHNPGRHT